MPNENADGKCGSVEDEGQWIRTTLSRFESPLIRYALHLTSDLEVARDVVQDVFLRLWKARKESTPAQWVQVESHLAEWLYTVCRNRALDVRRKERRMSHMNETLARQLDGHDSACSGPDSHPDGVLAALGASTCAPVGPDDLQAEQLRQALRLVDLLPDRQREILRLKFQAGLTYREISSVMNLSVTNVGVLIHNAIKAVRAGMQTSMPAGAVATTPVGREGAK